ncbi:hypothetical protein GF389_04460 [Candidatus Dojkabacteria bacterium]|nr:hypothetical protein [Candidatus Dojkabacteria bacterium]
MKFGELPKNLPIKRIITGLCLIVLIGFSPIIVDKIQTWRARAAVTIFWDGGGDGSSWDDPLNWNTDNVPVPADEVLIDTSTIVNIDVPISIKALTLGKSNGSATSTLNFDYDAIGLSPITITDYDLIIYPAAQITHSEAVGDTIGGRINIEIQTGDLLVYGTINANEKGFGLGNGDGSGVDGTEGNGGGGYGGNGGDGQTKAGGGTYGSYLTPYRLGSSGGNYGNVPGKGGGAIKIVITTGDATINGPITAKGGYGNIYSGRHVNGGGSGGSIWIDASSGNITGTSYLNVDGGSAGNDNYDGGGGGGGRIAVYYNTSDLANEQFSAQGGEPTGNSSVIQKGGAGTVYLKGGSSTNGDLLLDNKNSTWQTSRDRVAKTPLDHNLNLDNLTVTNYTDIDYNSTLTIASQLQVDNASYFDISGTISASSLDLGGNSWFYNQADADITYSSIDWAGVNLVDNGGSFAMLDAGGDLTIPEGSTLYANTPHSFTNVTVNGILSHTANTTLETYKLDYTTSGNFMINLSGAVNVDEKGYIRGEGSGAGEDANLGSGGAAYGGYGGDGRQGNGGSSYGFYSTPNQIGSGGGNHTNTDIINGGNGGGALKLTVGGTLTVNGPISSNGGIGLSYGSKYVGGGGSGGSIWIDADTISGSNSISADGGGSQNDDYDGGGGGGGRIALYYTTSNNLSNNQISAYGGEPEHTESVQKGGAGTIYIKDSDDGTDDGTLIIDNGNTSWETSIDKVGKTTIPSEITTLKNLTVNNFANVDDGPSLDITDTISIDNISFYDVGGTLTTDTLTITGESWLFNQSAANISYNTLNWTGSNIVDDGGTFPLMSNGSTLTIPEQSVLHGNVPRTFTDLTVNGVLTHSANTSAETYKINYTITNNFEVTPTGSVNVDEKGYADGYGEGKGEDGSNGNGGGGYGGLGGDGVGRAGGTTYGYAESPDRIGSPGGHYGEFAGHGGGAMKFEVSGTATINGSLSANGGNGEVQGRTHANGGGSGGSIWVIADTIAGTGSITTNGGNGAHDNYDSGGGGGGRIALYFTQDNSSFSTLVSTGGIPGDADAQPGEAGTIFLGGQSSDPINLRQYRTNGTTAIGQGAATNEDSVITTFQVQDSNESDTLTPEVEIQTLGTSFTDVATHTGDPVEYNGSTVTAEVTVNGLVDGAEYHWQARVCDATDICSEWVSFGNNTEAEADVRVVLNTSPSSPVIPETSAFINGAFTNDLQPTLAFVLSDPNATDSVQHRIQIDENSDFSSPLIDYTSALAGQGTQSFIVGQPAGDGTYTEGAESQELVTGNYYWRIKAIDDKGGESEWTVAPGTPSFMIDLSSPTNATNARMKAHVGATNEYTSPTTDVWFSRDDLYFSWDAGSDAQGVKGYCLYLGLNGSADPATDKGILGSSPVSTSGTTCGFITDQTEIDFSNVAYQGYDWLSSSETKYTFKIKTIDAANNIFSGPDDSNYISFNFDNTAPQNVIAISAASGAFSSTSDMYFSWPATGQHTASDTHSGVLGFQYALNTQDTWYGDFTDETTGLDYSLLSKDQPLYFPQEVQDLIEIGQNTIFFRIIDNAGNVSELRTAYINFGGEAPNFDQGDVVTVTPSQNTENLFGFSWPEANVSDGNTLKSYYYMINTPPPVSYATITSNSATYIATTQRSIPSAYISGLRKGANTIYVVAVDENDNYSSTNTISATFQLNTELPDPPQNMTIADGSIKDVEIWRAALVWDDPEYKGTGDLRYYIQRSEDMETWEDIANTTAHSYVDTVPESKEYFWRVGTTDNSDESIASPSYSSIVSITPRGKYLEPATLTSGPAASSISTTKATITWTTNRTSDSKIAFGLASGNYYDSEPSVSAQVTEHTVNLSNLEPGKTYYYKAKWTDEDGNTGMSDESTFTTEPPPTVKDVRVSSIGISGALINFTTYKASGVKLYYGPNTSFGGLKEVVTSKVESTYTVELDNLEDGTKYYYQINGFDDEGKEYAGTILDFETLPRPEVSNVVIQQVAKTAQSSILVSWESNTAVSSIVTYYPEGNPEQMRDAVNVELEDGEHQMLIKELFPDTNYVITVRGRDAIGNEAVSDTKNFKTSTDTRAPQISDLIVESSNTNQSNTTTSQLIVSWTTDELATSQVEYGEGSGTSYSQLTQEDKDLSYNHVVIISGLTPSKVYHLRAISKDESGNVTKSVDTVTITPKATDDALYLVVTTLEEAFGFLDEL